MEFRYPALLRIILFAGVCLSSFCGLRAADQSGIPVVASDFALPQYSKDGEVLQFIVFGSRAKNVGADVELEQPILAIISETLSDVNRIQPLNGVKPYPIHAKIDAVRSFWKDKDYLQAVIFAPSARLDKTTMTLHGNDLASLRSRELDIDGVGFDADHERKFIHIRSQVRVVIRPDIRRQVTPDGLPVAPKIKSLEEQLALPALPGNNPPAIQSKSNQKDLHQ